MLIIFLSCLKLIIETYYDEEKYESLKHTFSNIDYVFNALFILEMVLKVVAKGFVVDKGSYLREISTRLDFFIVIASIVDMSLTKYDLAVLKVLRVLRPLRFLSKYKTMRVVVNSLIHAFGPLLNVGLVLIITWIVFAILGIYLLSGKMWRCTSGEIGVVYDVNAAGCLANKMTWSRSYYNFDNIVEAMITLFLISTKEGWQFAMFDAMDSGDSFDGGAIYNNHPGYVAYYVIFLLVSTFFLLDLVAGVIFFQYGEELEEQISEATHACTHEQTRWIMIQKLIYQASPTFDLFETPKNKFRKICFKIVQSAWFNSLMLLVIVFNMIILCMDYEYAGDKYSDTLDKINYSLTWLFVAEFILKFIAIHMHYFKSGWNIMDFFIVIISLADFFYSLVANGDASNANYLRFVKVIRISRVFRIVKLFKSKMLSGFVKLIKTLIFSLPMVLNVYVLFAMNLFIFSIIGAFTFKDIEGKSIEEFNNNVWSFKKFHLAFFTLFRCSTGEEWQKIMFLYGDIPGYYTYSRLIFVGFALLNEFLVMNLLKLVVVEIFESFYFDPESPLNIMDDFKKIFDETWNLFTIPSKGDYIHSSQIARFFTHLK